MDLNDKVEQLAQITATLKNEINELKGNGLNTKVDELEHETAELKNDINDLRYCLMQQNEQILSLLMQQTEKLEETTEGEKFTPPIFNQRLLESSKRFPIASVADLDAIEELIDDTNKNELIAVIQQLLVPHGIIKNINTIISTEVIMQSNVDGHHNKQRLLNYTKFMDVLYQAAFSDGYSHKAFLDDVRRGLKMVKNRYNKNLCRQRQSLRQGLKQEQNQDETQDENQDQDEYEDQDQDQPPPSKLLKIEEIFFD